MTAAHRLAVAPNSTAGLLLSLAHGLPDPRCALARRAARIARQLAARRSVDRSLALAAADMLAALLDADATAAHDTDPDLLDSDFDA